MIRDIAFSIAAGQSVDLHAVGNFIRYRSGNGDITVEPPDQGAAVLATGNKLRYSEPFKQLRLTNAGGSTVTGSLIVGDGDFQDDRISGEVSIVHPSLFTSPVDVAVPATNRVQLVAASATRREVLITNLAVNTDTMRLGGPGVFSDVGIELAPGQTASLSTSAAVWAYNPKASPQSVGIAEILQ